jgi:hypothetical protein
MRLPKALMAASLPPVLRARACMQACSPSPTPSAMRPPHARHCQVSSVCVELQGRLDTMTREHQRADSFSNAKAVVALSILSILCISRIRQIV